MGLTNIIITTCYTTFLLGYDCLFSAAYIAIIIVAIVSHFRAYQDVQQQTEQTDDRIYHVF